MPGFVNVSLLAAAAFALSRHQLVPLPPRALAAALWLGVGPMALAFFCWDRAMRTGSAARIGALSYLDPLLSTVLLGLTLGKPLTAATWMGMALIVGGAGGPALLALRLSRPPAVS
jgi:drug/metabolite transporter (DMT)-like permease